MPKAPYTQTEIRIARLTHEIVMAAVPDFIRVPFAEVMEPACKQARAMIQALRDAPHELLDAARGNRMASGDAAVFWNAMIDAISPPDTP